MERKPLMSPMQSRVEYRFFNRGKVFPRHKTAHFVRYLYAPKLDSSIKSEDHHCFQKQKNNFFVFELFISSFAGASSQV
ncbi:MAG: hypothetical protein PHH77_11025, partial [Victivallaceae bacterium]|nr:hypothetical protein [Victivallaceae bacterium]